MQLFHFALLAAVAAGKFDDQPEVPCERRNYPHGLELVGGQSPIYDLAELWR